MNQQDMLISKLDCDCCNTKLDELGNCTKCDLIGLNGYTVYGYHCDNPMCTVTNPIYLFETRLQLNQNETTSNS